MRALLQRVEQARVEVEGRTIGSVGPGLLILLGVAEEDGEAQAEQLARKCAHLRLFGDERGRLEYSLLERGGQALVVSQFTLYGEVQRGRRPSWSRAASGPRAEALYRRFCDGLRGQGVEVAEGAFGVSMRVHLINDGPVTLMVEV